VFYLWKTCVPLRLSPIYELVLPLDPWEWRFAGAAVLVALISVGLVTLRRRCPAALAAWTTYLVLLAPVSGLLQAGPQLVADRYSYLSCLPWAALAAGLALEGLTARPRARVATLAAMPVLLIALGGATARQTRIWRDSEALWSQALSLNPGNRHALLHLGTLRLEQAAESLEPATRRSRLEESESLLRRGSERSHDPLFLLNLGLCKLVRAEERPEARPELLQEAEELVRRAIDAGSARGPPPWMWRLRLATVLCEQARFEEALELLQAIVDEQPESVEARRMISVALSGLDRWDAAAEHLERAVALDPQDASLWLRLGLTWIRLGRREEARAALEEVMQLRQRELGEQADEDALCSQARAAIAGLAGP
jgi:tetratricopeptide (TPR) repeat protein